MNIGILPRVSVVADPQNTVYFDPFIANRLSIDFSCRAIKHSNCKYEAIVLDRSVVMLLS
jgi:hypothetical protein